MLFPILLLRRRIVAQCPNGFFSFFGSAAAAAAAAPISGAAAAKEEERRPKSRWRRRRRQEGRFPSSTGGLPENPFAAAAEAAAAVVAETVRSQASAEKCIRIHHQFLQAFLISTLVSKLVRKIATLYAYFNAVYMTRGQCVCLGSSLLFYESVGEYACFWLPLSAGRGHSEGPGKERKEGEERKRAFFFFFAPSFSKVRTAPFGTHGGDLHTRKEEGKKAHETLPSFSQTRIIISSFLPWTDEEREKRTFFVPIPFPPFHFLSWGVGRTFLSLFPFSSVRCRSSLWASVGCSGEGGREANWAEAAAGHC